jgi:hypothetical protein
MDEIWVDHFQNVKNARAGGKSCGMPGCDVERTVHLSTGEKKELN